MSNNKKIILGVVSVIFVVYLLFMFVVGVINAQNTMNWCQYKNGLTYWSSSKQEETGKRWEPNPLTIGLTGECIDPGDKGL